LEQRSEDGYENIKAIYQQMRPFKNRKAGALSGGMKQKLALRCALVHRTSVCCSWTKPTTGVEPGFEKRAVGNVVDLETERHYPLGFDPYLDEVRKCDREGFLDKGRMPRHGSTGEILTQFADIFNPAGLEHTENGLRQANEKCHRSPATW
jgi:ABC-2 type transport system ATP-binding protein